MMAPIADDAAPVAPAVARQAVRWWLALQDGQASAADSAGLAAWRAQHPEHELAWQRIEAVSGQLAAIPAPLATAAMAAPARAKRRHAARLLAALLVAGGGAAVLPVRPAWQSWTADASTATGQRRSMRLPDGSLLVINTDSAVNLRFDAQQRVVQLLRGEVMVQTAPDSGERPFLVQTDAGQVRALGTRFTVRQQIDGSVAVGVLQHAVELQPRDTPAARQVLQAGQQGSFTRQQIGQVRQIDAGAGAWVDGMLVVSHCRLDAFLHELARYRRGRLVCDPEVAGALVSGTFPLGDTGQVLLALTSALPVELHYFTRYWVSVRPRRQKS